MLKLNAKYFALLPMVCLLASCAAQPGTVKFKGDNGAEVNVSTTGQASYPAGMPVDQYPGSQVIVTSSNSNSTGKKQSVVELTTTDNSNTVNEYYKGKLTGAGWTIDPNSSLTVNGMIMLHALKDSNSITIQTMQDTTKGNATMIIITMS